MFETKKFYVQKDVTWLFNGVHKVGLSCYVKGSDMKE